MLSLRNLVLLLGIFRIINASPPEQNEDDVGNKQIYGTSVRRKMVLIQPEDVGLVHTDAMQHFHRRVDDQSPRSREDLNDAIVHAIHMSLCDEDDLSCRDAINATFVNQTRSIEENLLLGPENGLAHVLSILPDNFDSDAKDSIERIFDSFALMNVSNHESIILTLNSEIERLKSSSIVSNETHRSISMMGLSVGIETTKQWIEIIRDQPRSLISKTVRACETRSFVEGTTHYGPVFPWEKTPQEQKQMMENRAYKEDNKNQPFQNNVPPINPHLNNQAYQNNHFYGTYNTGHDHNYQAPRPQTGGHNNYGVGSSYRPLLPYNDNGIGPSNQNYRPPPSNQNYGPPPPNNNYGVGPPNQSYRPPPPNNNYGPPPPHSGYGRPPPNNAYTPNPGNYNNNQYMGSYNNPNINPNYVDPRSLPICGSIGNNAQHNLPPPRPQAPSQSKPPPPQHPPPQQQQPYNPHTTGASNLNSGNKDFDHHNTNIINNNYGTINNYYNTAGPPNGNNVVRPMSAGGMNSMNQRPNNNGYVNQNINRPMNNINPNNINAGPNFHGNPQNFYNTNYGGQHHHPNYRGRAGHGRRGQRGGSYTYGSSLSHVNTQTNFYDAPDYYYGAKTKKSKKSKSTDYWNDDDRWFDSGPEPNYGPTNYNTAPNSGRTTNNGSTNYGPSVVQGSVNNYNFLPPGGSAPNNPNDPYFYPPSTNYGSYPDPYFNPAFGYPCIPGNNPPVASPSTPEPPTSCIIDPGEDENDSSNSPLWQKVVSVILSDVIGAIVGATGNIFDVFFDTTTEGGAFSFSNIAISSVLVASTIRSIAASILGFFAAFLHEIFL